MAENKNLLELLKEVSKRMKDEPFKPSWYYNKEGDCIESFWEQAPYYAERINNSITLYRDEQTRRVIGVKLKNAEQGIKGKDVNDYHRGD